MGLELKIIENKDKQIVSTDFTIVDFVKKTEDIEGRNEFLSRNIIAIEIFGKFSITDAGVESKEVHELSCWAKRVAHEKDAYRKVELKLFDNNNEEYDRLVFEKAFLIEYNEKFENVKGFMDYYAFIRKFDDTEGAVKAVRDASKDVKPVVGISDTNREYAKVSNSIQDKLKKMTDTELLAEYDKYKDLPHVVGMGSSLYFASVKIEMRDRGMLYELKDNWTFQGKSFLATAEGNYNYVYSTKDTSIPRKQWTGAFNSSEDLTFGIGHKVESASEYAEILGEISGKTDSQIQTIVGNYLNDDIDRFVDATNKYVYDNKIYITQNQFDAIVLLIFNNGEGLLDSTNKKYNSDLCDELIKNSGNSNPTFNETTIIKAFTYTKSGGVRVEGLVTRCNNEISLFLNNDYNYYDKKTLISKGLDYIKY